MMMMMMMMIRTKCRYSVYSVVVFRLFAPQKRLAVPIRVKFGAAERVATKYKCFLAIVFNNVVAS